MQIMLLCYNDRNMFTSQKVFKVKKNSDVLLRCRELTKPFQKLSTERNETCNNPTEAILIVTLNFNNIINTIY